MSDYFPLWLKTAGWNADIDFYLFTDADMREYEIPQNVRIVSFSWEELVGLFQKKFSFRIALGNPYKLCDFKPSYGEVFEEYLRGI